MTGIDARAVGGIRVLLLRQVGLYAVTFAGGVVLARILAPGEFGLFAIATFVVRLISLVGDLGVVPSFVQRRAELTEHDLGVGFTLQQALTTAVVVVLVIAAPGIAALYPEAPAGTVWLIRALSLSLYLTSWRSMTVLQLERHLHFGPLAWVEVIESLSYQVCAVTLAVLGLGVWSLVWAVLLRGLLGAVLLYSVAPWRVRLAFDAAAMREIMRFGIPFQLQTVLNEAGNWVTPTLVAVLLGPQAVGFLAFASSNARRPLILVDNVMRVAYPHFCRIQDDLCTVERLLIRYLTFLLMPVLLWSVLLGIAGPRLVELIYTSKWLPAVPALVVFAAGLTLDTIAWTIGLSLNALGRVGFTTRVVGLRSVANVAFAVPLTFAVGLKGIAVAHLIASILTVPWLLGGFERGVGGRILACLSWTLVPTAMALIVGLVSLHLLGDWPFAVLAEVVAMIATFVLVAVRCCPPWLRKLADERMNSAVRRMRGSAPEVGDARDAHALPPPLRR